MVSAASLHDEDQLTERIKNITVSSRDEKDFKRDPMRWVVALLLCLNSAMSGFILSTFIAIWFVAVDFFGVDNLGINMFSIVYMIFFFPCSLLSVFWTQRYGVGSAISVGAVFNFLCCWVRVGGSYHGEKWASYGIVLFGQCLAAFGQPFLLNAPPRIANDWFPVDERDYVMHIMTQSNNIGGALGTVIPAYQVIVDPITYAYSRDEINRMLIYQGAASFVIMLLTMVFVRNRPPTPPTADVEIQLKLRENTTTAAALATVMQMLRDFRTLLSSLNFCILLSSFACIVGVSWAFLAVVGQLVFPCGYDTVATGWAGFSLGFAGVAGSFFIAIVLRYFKNYVHVTRVTIILSCAAGIWCIGANKPNDLPQLIAAWNVFGLFTGPLIPVTLEFAAEMTYPVPADNSAALLFTCVNWVALSLTLGLSPLLGYKESSTCSNIVNPASGLCLAFLLLGAFISLFLFKEYYRQESVAIAKVEGEAEEVKVPLKV